MSKQELESMISTDVKPKHAGGRPTLYTPELAKRICDLVASHPYGLKKLTSLYPDLPEQTTIYLWSHKNDEFFKEYVVAREKQAHLLFDSAIDELEEIEKYKYTNLTTGATDVAPGIIAMKKAIANQKSRHAAILNRNYMLKQKDDDTSNSDDTLTKIRDLVNDFNKTNTSDI